MELELIDHLRRTLPGADHVLVGPGDDAAVLAWQHRADVVLSVDMVMDGVDFRLEEIAPQRAGRKALAVNLSDLAAMAALPVAAVVSLALPRRGGLELAKQLYEGMVPLAQEFGVAIVGGDTNAWDAPLAVSVTVLGTTTDRGALRRGGARPGDRLLVTGPLGGSILGHHLDFTPRVREALWLAQQAELHAGIDISDGLALDLARLCQESGCGAELFADQIPISDAARRLAATPNEPVQRAAQQQPAQRAGLGLLPRPLAHALADGEDFELLLAVAPEDARRLVGNPPPGCPIFQIGECLAERGLWLRDAQQHRLPLEPHGFEHRFS